MNIFQQLEFEYVPKNKYIFNYGEKGRKMYLILNGEVGILLPLKENEISQQELQKLKHLKSYNNDESLTKRKYGLEQI